MVRVSNLLSLLPAARAAASLRQADAGERAAVARCVELAEQGAEFVLIRAAVGADGLSLLARAASRVVLAVQGHAAGLTDGYLLLKQVHAVIGHACYGVVLTRLRDGAARPALIANLQRVAGDRLDAVLTDFGSLPVPREGQPFAFSDAVAHGAALLADQTRACRGFGPAAPVRRHAPPARASGPSRIDEFPFAAPRRRGLTQNPATPTSRGLAMYNASGTLNKDQLVTRFAPLVKRIAYHLMAKLPASVEVDDLIQNGMMGLLDAIGRFEEGLGAQFETYAVQRIRGAMLDGLRDNDWLPRSLRRDMRRIESAIHVLEQKNGRQPSESELAETLGMPLAEYQKMLNEARGHQLVYFEDFADSDDDDFFEHNCGRSEADPLEILTQKGMRESLVKAIEDLPEREKMVMGLYYDEELNLREIGEVMGVSESRICQLHTPGRGSAARTRVRGRQSRGQDARTGRLREGQDAVRNRRLRRRRLRAIGRLRRTDQVGAGRAVELRSQRLEKETPQGAAYAVETDIRPDQPDRPRRWGCWRSLAGRCSKAVTSPRWCSRRRF